MARDRGISRARQRARELLVKALYQWQLAGHGVAELSSQFQTDPDYEKSDKDYFSALLPVAIDDSPALDLLIAKHAARGVDQLDPVGRAILLLAMAELKFRGDVPTRVVINEAVELAKRYGTTDSFKFVNAVLDKTSREIERPAVLGNGA